jgi:hypothetical protein
VKEADALEKIAQHYYGDRTPYRKIFEVSTDTLTGSLGCAAGGQGHAAGSEGGGRSCYVTFQARRWSAAMVGMLVERRAGSG